MILFVLSHQAWATSQWARKYDMGCTSCHTAFPRLTYFGEKFMKNGYQMPGTEDGDDNKERIGSSLVLDELQNLFGIRLSLTPLKIKNDEGGKKSDINIGNADWLQLFTAGSIFKNTSIFIETELQDEKTIHHNWFHLGFHNLFGQSLANIRVGKLSPMDWHSMSGRLRMIPNVGVRAISDIKSSKGNVADPRGADSVPLGSGVPAIEVYGYKGPAIYSLGISNGNGKSATDPNEYKNVFGTIKLEMPSGLLEGSSISCWGMNGVDTTDSSKTFYKNDFWRSSIAGNLRWTDLDLIIAGFYGEDDNWNLDSNNNKNIFKAGALQLGYNFIPSLYGVLQYDIVGSEDDKTIEFNKITPSIWYFPRENMRFGLTGRLDIQPTSDVHLKRQDEFTATFRMML
ncbi:MAG: hypothetical protein HY999_04935 [Nitrospinae bacterium]|nr:hypothetical protein [Nitrospinota bacterium]